MKCNIEFIVLHFNHWFCNDGSTLGLVSSRSFFQPVLRAFLRFMSLL